MGRPKKYERISIYLGKDTLAQKLVSNFLHKKGNQQSFNEMVRNLWVVALTSDGDLKKQYAISELKHKRDQLNKAKSELSAYASLVTCENLVDPDEIDLILAGAD